jgi:hypothetical protein
MSKKGQGKGSPSPLSGKPYKDSVTEIFQSTVLQPRDIDQKCIQLLDALQKAGKADEGCKHLKTSLDGVAREKVQNWKAYVYKLLRDFDSEVYTAYKAAAGSRQQKKDRKEKESSGGGALNGGAPEFTPGQWWSGALPTAGAGYPNMMMIAPQMMMPPGAGAPPPPPTKAAEVPKKDEAKKDAEAPKKDAEAR